MIKIQPTEGINIKCTEAGQILSNFTNFVTNNQMISKELMKQKNKIFLKTGGFLLF